jgi:hypothetical protein
VSTLTIALGPAHLGPAAWAEIERKKRIWLDVFGVTLVTGPVAASKRYRAYHDAKWCENNSTEREEGASTATCARRENGTRYQRGKECGGGRRERCVRAQQGGRKRRRKERACVLIHFGGHGRKVSVQ